MNNPVADFYRANPRMVSSPFGGVEGVDCELFAEVFRLLEVDLAGKAMLDVGCGRGFIGEVVRGAGGAYTGMDLVVSRGGFRLAQGDAGALPFADASFDGLFCIDAFEHLPEPGGAAAEFRRVLRPGGFLYLSAPNYSNVAGLAKKVYEGLGLYAKDTWAPFGRWTPQELERPLTGRFVRGLFSNAGFSRVRRIGYGAEVGLGLFPWVDHPKMPEAIQFRLQRMFASIGPPIARVWPGASLHGFWKIEV